MTTKSYAKRDSATAVLRKAGIDKSKYADYIALDGDKFALNIGKDGAPVPHTAPASKSKGPRKTRDNTVSAVARRLILAGKTNEEVGATLKAQFYLDDAKVKKYPTWYRCELKRAGLLKAAA